MIWYSSQRRFSARVSWQCVAQRTTTTSCTDAGLSESTQIAASAPIPRSARETNTTTATRALTGKTSINSPVVGSKSKVGGISPTREKEDTRPIVNHTTKHKVSCKIINASPVISTSIRTVSSLATYRPNFTARRYSQSLLRMSLDNSRRSNVTSATTRPLMGVTRDPHERSSSRRERLGPRTWDLQLQPRLSPHK